MLKELIQSQDRAALQARLTRNVKPMACGCVEWKGRVNNSGYGRCNFRVNGEHRTVYAHRLFFVLATGRNIPENRVVDHKCQNAKCVNPAHLQLVAPETNSRLVHSRARRAAKAAAATA